MTRRGTSTAQINHCIGILKVSIRGDNDINGEHSLLKFLLMLSSRNN